MAKNFHNSSQPDNGDRLGNSITNQSHQQPGIRLDRDRSAHENLTKKFEKDTGEKAGEEGGDGADHGGEGGSDDGEEGSGEASAEGGGDSG